jgi:hypothetical protein
MTQRSNQGERIGLVITNTTKLAGIVVAVHEALLVQQVRPIVLAVAALMMAGAQSLESALTAFFGGARPTPKDKE